MYSTAVAIKLINHHLMPAPVEAVLDQKWKQRPEVHDLIGYFTKGDAETFFYPVYQYYDIFIYDSWEEHKVVYKVHVPRMSMLDWTKIAWIARRSIYEWSSFCYVGPRDGWDIKELTPEDMGWCENCLNPLDDCVCPDTRYYS